jgi:predicted RNase H-like nuclease (RuvC/YqgF family)
MCGKRLKPLYLRLSLLFLLFLSQNSLPGETLQEMSTQELLNKLKMNSLEIESFQNNQMEKLTLSVKNLEEMKPELNQLQKDFPILKADLEKVQTIQKELESSTAKISTSFKNYKTDTTKDIKNLQIQNDILTFTVIALTTYLIINSLASP